MKLLVNKLKLQKELDQQGLFLWGAYFLIALGSLYSHFRLTSFFSNLFFLVLLTGYFLTFYRLLKGLYYTFWTFMVITIMWILWQLSAISIFSIAGFLYIMSLVLLCFESNQLWTPIYYPIVSWWEYDFRYRHDVKIKIIFAGSTMEGRLTDLRKGAGCVAAFKDIAVGELLQVELEEGKVFKAEIMSKRYYSLGRPLSYGVRFDLPDQDDRENFRVFSDKWQRERKLKRLAKLEPVNE